MDKSAAVFHRTACVLLVTAVFLAPFPLGSNRDWAWSPLALIVGAALIAYSLAQFGTHRAPVPWPLSLVVAAVAMSTVIAWAILCATSVLSPGHLVSFFASADAALGRGATARGVLDAERAMTASMLLATYATVFWLSLRLSFDRRFASAISFALLCAALLVTLYGWAMEVSTRSCVVLTIVKRPFANGDPCSLSGTFVNSSNYSDFAALMSLMCLANLQGSLLQVGSSSGSSRARWRARLMVLTGVGAFYLVALIFLLGSIVYSASRAGLLSFIAAALSMTLLTATLYDQRRSRLVATSMAVSLVIAATMIIGGESVIRRFLVLLSEGETDRSQVFALTIDAITVSPWVGWGLGSFSSLYPVFQPTSVPLIFDKAHNTYLENALDLGIPAALLLLVAIVSPVFRCVRGLRERRRDTQYAAAAVGAAIHLGLHSTVDFGAQIPVVAVAFSAILGVGWAQSWSSRQVASDEA